MLARRVVLRLAALASIMCEVLLVFAGCGGGASQVPHRHTSHHGVSSGVVELQPTNDSGVSGTATFKDTSGGVVVKLTLRNLPKPDTLYLAHIHPGTCAEGYGHEQHGEEAGHEHVGASGHEHGAGGAEEIEYPLSQVNSDSEGHGSSTTTLRKTSVEELFSGEPKNVNVHTTGSGNPPILTCADLMQAG